MDWLNILNQIFQIAVIPLIGVGALYLTVLISVKTKEAKDKIDNDKAKEYLDMLNDTITNCVIATTQTYVEALKNKNAFDADAQKVALNKTYTAVMCILNKEAKKYLEKTLGDLEEYVLNKIEAEVATTKVYFE